MHTYKVREHLTDLLMGKVSIADLQAIGTDEALEAVTISARNFNDVTHTARDIHSAMLSTFVSKVKGGAFEVLTKAGIRPADAVRVLGKYIEWRINWSWTSPLGIYLSAVTPLPAGMNGYAFPLECVLQDRDADQCRKLTKWVLDKVAVTQSMQQS